MNSLSDSEVDTIFNSMSKEEALDFCTSKTSIEIQKDHPEFHISWWNPGKMERFLVEAGFTRTYLSGYNQSYAPVLRNKEFFDIKQTHQAMYMEATKTNP